MSTMTIAPSVAIPVMKLWTVDEFHDLGESGLFEGRRAHLVDGVILEEGQMNPPHAMVIEKLPFVLFVALGAGWRIRTQIPLPLGLTTDPMPDFALIMSASPPPIAHPTTADLVIEVSDTTFAYDSKFKMSLYAAGGIEDYWIIDLNNNLLIVHRDPQPDTTQPHGYGYANVLQIPATGTISPLAMPTATLKVEEMLP